MREKAFFEESPLAVSCPHLTLVLPGTEDMLYGVLPLVPCWAEVGSAVLGLCAKWRRCAGRVLLGHPHLLDCLLPVDLQLDPGE